MFVKFNCRHIIRGSIAAFEAQLKDSVFQYSS